jgi:penicillin amidase
MMAWDLGGNWGSELLRLRLALRMPVERIRQVLPPYPGEAPLATADYAALFHGLGLKDDFGQQALNAAPLSGVEGAGSNNWAVAGRRSAGGAPLLANDPHLKLSAPALWYFARLQLPGWKLAGATMPGLPLLVLGQNQQVAWGFTNTAPDVQDLYLERVKPDDPTHYQTPEGWAPFETAQEVIRVKGAPEVKLQVRRSRHGPVVSDAGITQDLLGERPAHVLALRWTALDPDAESVSAALAMNRSRSVDGFLQATRGWVAPMQNMAVADSAGHIALVSPGRVPLRRPDNDLKGLVPAPGWDARYDWTGWVPADELPRQVDPAAGWVASANQRITAPNYPHYLTSEWAAPWREQRIEQLLQARPLHTVDSFAAMQADVQSLEAAPWLPWLQRVRSDHPLAAESRRQLQGFDGSMAADRAAPLIFWAWSRHFTRRVLADDVGEALFDRSLASRSFRDAMQGVLARNDAAWCDDRRTPAQETCAQQADAAFTDALDELQARFGSAVADWRWGDAHQARSEHRPFSRVKALSRWFELRTPVGGDTFTVNASRVTLRTDIAAALYLDEHGPSLRAIYDLGDPRRSRFMHSSGQSGLVFSPHYRDFVERWAAVAYVPLWDGSGEGPQDVLVLRPDPEAPAR